MGKLWISQIKRKPLVTYNQVDLSHLIIWSGNFCMIHKPDPAIFCELEFRAYSGTEYPSSSRQAIGQKGSAFHPFRLGNFKIIQKRWSDVQKLCILRDSLCILAIRKPEDQRHTS